MLKTVVLYAPIEKILKRKISESIASIVRFLFIPRTLKILTLFQVTLYFIGRVVRVEWAYLIYLVDFLLQKIMIRE